MSRVVTSEGWRPHKQQVGQTGTKITPELYLACGISGAIQHIAGCAGAKHIIAINTDPGAPILAHADYAVIGDLHQVIPALVEALRAREALAEAISPVSGAFQSGLKRGQSSLSPRTDIAAGRKRAGSSGEWPRMVAADVGKCEKVGTHVQREGWGTFGGDCRMAGRQLPAGCHL